MLHIDDPLSASLLANIYYNICPAIHRCLRMPIWTCEELLASISESTDLPPRYRRKSLRAAWVLSSTISADGRLAAEIPR